MKYCSNCGEKLEDGAIFCPNCGTASGESQSKNINQKNDHNSASQSDDNQARVEQKNTFDDVKDMIQRNAYFRFIKKSLIKPSAIQNLNNSYYGWIHFGLLAILFTASIYFLLRGIILWSMPVSFMMRGDFEVVEMGLRTIRKVLLPRLSISIFVTYLAYPVSAFITLKFFTNLKRPFNDLLNQMAGLSTINIVMLLLSIIISLIFKTSGFLNFSLILIIWTALFMNIVYNYYIINNIQEGKIDNYYIVLISNLLLTFTSFIIVFVQMDTFSSIIQEIEYYLS